MTTNWILRLAVGGFAALGLAPVGTTQAQAQVILPPAQVVRVGDWDDLEDYYEDLRERREDYYDDLRERREDYYDDLEDYYEDAAKARRKFYKRHGIHRFPPPAPVVPPAYGPAYPPAPVYPPAYVVPRTHRVPVAPYPIYGAPYRRGGGVYIGGPLGGGIRIGW